MPPFLISVLRTAFPAVWGVLITALVAKLGLPDALAGILGSLDSDVLTMILLPAITTAYYAAARWLESQSWWPTLLARITLGSAQTPSYGDDDHAPREGAVTVGDILAREGLELPADLGGG